MKQLPGLHWCFKAFFIHFLGSYGFTCLALCNNERTQFPLFSISAVLSGFQCGANAWDFQAPCELCFLRLRDTNGRKRLDHFAPAGIKEANRRIRQNVTKAKSLGKCFHLYLFPLSLFSCIMPQLWGTGPVQIHNKQVVSVLLSKHFTMSFHLRICNPCSCLYTYSLAL